VVFDEQYFNLRAEGDTMRLKVASFLFKTAIRILTSSWVKKLTVHGSSPTGQNNEIIETSARTLKNTTMCDALTSIASQATQAKIESYSY